MACSKKLLNVVLINIGIVMGSASLLSAMDPGEDSVLEQTPSTPTLPIIHRNEMRVCSEQFDETAKDPYGVQGHFVAARHFSDKPVKDQLSRLRTHFLTELNYNFSTSFGPESMNPSRYDMYNYIFSNAQVCTALYHIEDPNPWQNIKAELSFTRSILAHHLEDRLNDHARRLLLIMRGRISLS